jgi:hypothetical protein
MLAKESAEPTTTMLELEPPAGANEKKAVNPREIREKEVGVRGRNERDTRGGAEEARERGERRRGGGGGGRGRGARVYDEGEVVELRGCGGVGCERDEGKEARETASHTAMWVGHTRLVV